MNDKRSAGSDLQLVELIRDEISTKNRMTFARFMDLALYHPEYGYYTAETERPGTEGDFLTAPETHPVFGWTLANQVAECWSLLGKPSTFTIREFGAGSGTLALHILEGLHRRHPAVLAATRYELQDLNRQNAALAVERLTAAGFNVGLAEDGDSPVTGLLLANELLDAFPAHRLVQFDDKLQENYVTWKDGWFAEEIGELSDQRLALSLSSIALAEHQRAEVSLAAQDWSTRLGDQLERGYALLIDYGYDAKELYSAPRFAGTLKGYFQHQVTNDPFQYVGRQDLTAHVDFTAISRAAGQSGLFELGLTSQAYFVAGLGIEAILMEVQSQAADLEEYLPARSAVMALIDPGGLGRFRVLGLGKEIDSNIPLSGFSFRL